jgi:2'-deoxynucleoside 5'-phosphate N-hydrolase
VRIYLACTVRGDRGGLTTARALSGLLERHGHIVLTTHLLADDADRAESSLSERQVYERDVEWLDGCDLLIAEASGSSFGVGFEVGYVLGRSAATRQRVLLLYDQSRRGQVSRLLVGNAHPNCTTYAYGDPGELLAFVERYLTRADEGIGRGDPAGPVKG